MGSKRSNLKLELSIKFHLGSICLSPELKFSLTPNSKESLIESGAGTFTNPSLGKSLFQSQVGTVVKFYCRAFDRDSNCNSQ